ncbi:MAG: DUF5060 domain-containing protein [Rhodothermales bacterium]|nr:DUF5060 domain-containing protein [Rhodothermales bacterium]
MLAAVCAGRVARQVAGIRRVVSDTPVRAVQVAHPEGLQARLRCVLLSMAILLSAASAPLGAVVPSRVFDDWWGGDIDETLLIPVTANDEGVGSTSVLVGLSPAGAGTLTGPSASDVYTFTPSAGWSGTASFTYRAYEFAGQTGDFDDALVTIVVSAPSTVIREDGTGDVPLYGVWERAVVNTTDYDSVGKNRFDFRAIELQGTFESPTSVTTDFFGFYDGDGAGGLTGTVWKIRFMPTEVGTYTYTLSFTDGTPIPGADGSFTVVDTGLPGPVALMGPSPPESYHLEDARGAAIAWKGYNLHGANKDVPLPAADQIHYYRGIVEDQLIGQGYNATMISSGRYWFGSFIDDPINGTFNLLRFTAADELNDLLAAQGVWTVNWTCFVGQQEDRWPDFYTFQDAQFPSDPDRYRPVVRYFTARYAPFYNYFGWSQSWETWETHGGINPDDSGKTEEVAKYLASISPWEKFPAAHDRARSDWTDWQRVQLRQIQSRTISDGNTRVSTGGFAGYDYVIIGAEDIWERSSGSLGQPRNGEEVRHAVWGEILAGVLPLYYEWNSFDHWPAGGPGNGEGDQYNKIALDYWTGRTTWYEHTMQNGLVGTDTANARASGWPGQEYLICDQNGGSNSIDLTGVVASTSFALEWLDPLTGDVTPDGVVSGGQIVTLDPPPSVSTEWCALLEWTCLADADCDDGDFCNGVETCDVGTGVCQEGTPPPNVLSGTTIVGPATHQACGTLTVGPSVTISGGPVVLRASESVVFVAPVTAESNASLRVELGQPIP